MEELLKVLEEIRVKVRFCDREWFTGWVEGIGLCQGQALNTKGVMQYGQEVKPYLAERVGLGVRDQLCHF